MPFQSIFRRGKQLWTGGKIPIGVADFDVAEIGRKDWQAALDVLAVIVPPQKRCQRKSMTKIVYTRMPLSVLTNQPKPGGQSPEESVDRVTSDLCPPSIDEPIRNLPAGKEALSANNSETSTPGKFRP